VDDACTDPLEMQVPLLVKPLHHYRDRADAPSWLKEANRRLSEADAVVVVSAEYNHSIPPALSNLLDHFPGSSFSYKPSGIVCYSMGEAPGRILCNRNSGVTEVCVTQCSNSVTVWLF